MECISINFNTSYVDINLKLIRNLTEDDLNFNTSYVDINPSKFNTFYSKKNEIIVIITIFF